MKFKKTLLAFSLMTLPFSSVSAYDLPGIDTGGTSFYNGAPAPDGPGLYFVEYLQSMKANTLKDSKSGSLGLPKEETDIFVPLTQLIYVSDKKWGNLTPGVTALLPFMAKSDVDDGVNNNILKSQTGVGDLTLGAFLQFDPIMGKNGPKFSQRIELDVIIPTGKYDKDNGINPGSNFYSIAPYYAATYWFTPKWTASTRIIYLWNAKNNDPMTSLGAQKSSQAGQALNINFASAYAISEKISLGINGYWLKQFTDTKVDGVAVSGRKEKVWSIGPGMVYQFSRKDSIFVNYYVEHDAENRAEGSRTVLRFNHKF